MAVHELIENGEVIGHGAVVYVDDYIVPFKHLLDMSYIRALNENDVPILTIRLHLISEEKDIDRIEQNIVYINKLADLVLLDIVAGSVNFVELSRYDDVLTIEANAQDAVMFMSMPVMHEISLDKLHESMMECAFEIADAEGLLDEEAD